MADTLTRDERSRNMAAIKSKGTKPEMFFRKGLFAMGYRYRNNVGNVFGHPDIYLAKYDTAIFIHGCFWHRHSGCKYAYTPKTRTEFWQKKFDANVKRDARVKAKLTEDGIRCLIIWECTVEKMMRDDVFKCQVYEETETFLNSETVYLEL